MAKVEFNETGFFGCPQGEERETAVIGGARVQDFEGGRIYSSLLGIPPRPPAYVPAVFVEALKGRGDVSVEFRFAPAGTANHAHLKFTAPLRENVVTGAGEMKWEYGRRYIGKWYAFWTR